MHLWTIHPRYLDDKGLVAAWREALLVQKVLSGVASGYRYHLQLIRFRSHPSPFKRRGAYLAGLAEEAGRRSYYFDVTKILEPGVVKQIEETESQLLYELAHLREKLHRRLPALHRQFRAIIIPQHRPLFRIIPGGTREWEKR